MLVTNITYLQKICQFLLKLKIKYNFCIGGTKNNLSSYFQLCHTLLLTLVYAPGNGTFVCRMALLPETLGNDISAYKKRSPLKASSGPVPSDMVCLF